MEKKVKPRASTSFSRTIRTSGWPSASTVASAMAFGSLGSDPRATSSHSTNRAMGSSRSKMVSSAFASSWAA
ncbi:hypothetical protein D3C73_1444300 [compost metagenome]